MPVRTEVLSDGARGGEELLSVAGGLKSLHALFALPSGLRRVLGVIVKIPMLTMFHSREDLALGSSIALEFIGDDHAWDVG